MAERECRKCGTVYRGLVCPVCHPRGSGDTARRKAWLAAQAARTDDGQGEGQSGASHNDNAISSERAPLGGAALNE